MAPQVFKFILCKITFIRFRRRHEEFRKTDQGSGQFVAIDDHAAPVSGKQAAALETLDHGRHILWAHRRHVG